MKTAQTAQRTPVSCSDCEANRDDYTVTLCQKHSKAVNMHDELVDACKQALKALTPWTDYKTQEANIALQQIITKVG